MAQLENILGVVGSFLREHSLSLVASAALLFLSATFSGCETSLFSLSTPELNRIRASRGRINRIIAQLHSSLKTLLPSILFCNMAVNVLIYALAAGIASQVGHAYGTGAAFVYSLVSLFVVVFFGEVFPKQLAISSSHLVARLTSPLVWFLYRLIARPMRIFNATVTAFERVFDHGRRDSLELREEELRLLVELSKNDGVISAGEYELIDGIVELPDVRMRDIMIPRVDVKPLSPGAGVEEIIETARKSRHCKIPVLDSRLDDLAGWVDARDVFADRSVANSDDAAVTDTYLRHFQFFSEHDRADQVLERIKGGGGDLFAVVDERGQIIGFFTLQDIMDEVLGHFGENGAAPPNEIRETGGRYIISGRLSTREWRDLFGVSQSIPRSATVGGLIVSLLGRMARPGDRVALENMEMTVVSTWHNRVTEVALKLIAPPSPGRHSARLAAREDT